MNAVEARGATDKLKAIMARASEQYEAACRKADETLETSRPLFAQLYLRRAWEALRYATWEKFCVAEFGVSERHAYRIKAAQKIQAELTTDQWSVTTIPESQCRELAAEKDPVVRKAILSEATEKGSKPTTAGRLRDITHRYKAATTAREKIDALADSKAELGRLAGRRDIKKRIGHAETAGDLIDDARKKYLSIVKTVERARRHYGIACANILDPVVERHLGDVVARCVAKAEKLAGELAGMA